MTKDSVPMARDVRRSLAAEPGLPGSIFEWVEALRGAAIERFRKNGFPTPKVEAWKFTKLGPLERIAFRSDTGQAGPNVTKAALAPYRLTPECHLAVFVNGRFRPDLSALDHLPTGTAVVGLASAGEDDLRALLAPPAIATEARARALFDLNTALAGDGAVIHLGRGAVLDPVQLLFVAVPDGEPKAFHPRSLIDAEAGSSATVLETYVSLGEGVYWTNAVTQVLVARNAVLRHYKLQAEGGSAYHVAATSVRLDHEAAYRMFALSLGAVLSRNELDIDLAAANAETRLSGASLARGEQHLDTTIRIDHAKPLGSSTQAFRSVVDGRAHTVFQGRIRVAPDAQKTDAQQISRSLLLSATASADTKPELEILADDVKCSHGAAVGDLDRDALFYLRARGMGEEEARRILIDAFVGELIGAVESDAARPYFRRAFDRWLSEGMGS
jgi:Fe-S cluster assembly protein SufD